MNSLRRICFLPGRLSSSRCPNGLRFRYTSLCSRCGGLQVSYVGSVRSLSAFSTGLADEPSQNDTSPTVHKYVPQEAREYAFNEECLAFRELCANDEFKSVQKFYSQLRDVACLGANEYMALLNLLQRICEGHAEGSLDEVETTLKSVTMDLQSGHVKLPPFVWSRALRVLVDAHMVDDALPFWEHIRTRILDGIDNSGISSRCYAAAIELYAALGYSTEECKDLMRELRHNEVVPGPEVYLSMISVLFWHQENEEAMRFLSLALEVFGGRLSTNWISSIIVRLSQWGRIETAQEIFSVYATANLLPGSATMNTMVTEMRFAGTPLKSIMEIFLKYAELGGQLQAPLVNTVLTAILQSQAGKALDEQKSAKGPAGMSLQDRPRSPFQNVEQEPAQDSFRSTRQTVDAFLSTMRKYGFEPIVSTYNALISGYAALGARDDAQNALEALDRSELQPDAVTYRVLLKSLKEFAVPIETIESVWVRLMECNLSSPYVPAKHDLDWVMLLQNLEKAKDRELLSDWIAMQVREACKVYSPNDTNTREIPKKLVMLFSRNKARDIIVKAKNIP